MPISLPAPETRERHFVVGDGHDAALRILHLDREHGHVLAIGGDFLAVRRHHQFCRGAGGLALRPSSPPCRL